MRNSFNFLLIALICMDSCFLITSFLDCFRRGFNIMTQVQVMMFPYFIFPFMNIAVTGSIFMTVAIAFERYWAVHYPIDYSQVSFEEFGQLNRNETKYSSLLARAPRAWKFNRNTKRNNLSVLSRNLPFLRVSRVSPFLSASSLTLFVFFFSKFTWHCNETFKKTQYTYSRAQDTKFTLERK